MWSFTLPVSTQQVNLQTIISAGTSIPPLSETLKETHKNMEESQIYSPKTLEFVTVASEYCKALEHCREFEQHEFIDVMRNLLPMVYLKVSLIGEIEEADGYNEPKVTEDDYNYVRSGVAAVLAEKDDYLDVFVEDFKYSEQPILCTISENLADIYQALRNLLEVFRSNYEDAMQVALYDTVEDFKLYWGQTLLNALKALHDVRFSVKD